MTTVFHDARLALAAAVGVAFLATAQAQPRTREDCEKAVGYSPSSGQAGKDVVWVPTPDALVSRMLRMAGTTANDYVVDLGAGDGKIAIAASKEFGARALGIEYNPEMVKLAQCMVKAAGAEGKTRVVEGDIFKEDFSRADIVTAYLLPELNLCIRHRLLAMRPGVRVAAHDFHMGDWDPDESAEVENHAAYLWHVPARVGGKWSFREEGGGLQFSVTLEQAFQKIGGEVVVGKTRRQLVGAHLRGEEIRFTFNDEKGVQRTLVGKVKGGEIAGELRNAGQLDTAITGRREGAPGPAPWAEMLPQCGKYYGKTPA